MGKQEILDYTQNRELSWLRFNQRVLEEARDETVPLMERMKFVAIFTSNLDEFFMIRVGSLYDMAAADNRKLGNKKIVIVLTKNQGYRKKVVSPALQRVYRRAYKSYPNLVRTIFRRSFEYNKLMNHIDQLEKAGKIFVIRPQVKPVSRLERSKESLEAFYEHGYQHMEERMDELRTFLKA